jgi:mannosyltransferase
MADRRNAGWQRWALGAILLLAFSLRVYRLGADSLWYDETVSLHLAGKSLPALVAHTAGDIHPPGYYLLLHAWIRLAGSSDFSAAFFSLWFGLLLVAAAYRLAARLSGPGVGTLAALVVAISPYNLWYSQEARMYTLGAVLALGLLAAVVSLWLAPRPASPAWTQLGAYALCGALGLWVLYYFAFLLIAVNLMVGVWWLLGWRQRRVGWGWLGRWALAQGAVLLLYSPWIPVAWRQATQPPVPPWRGFTALGELLAETWSALSLGQSVDAGQVWPALVLVAALVGLALLDRSSRALAGRWLLAGTVFLPVFLIYVASFLTPLYHVRYAFTYSTPFYVILAGGLGSLGRRWRPLLWLGLAVVVLCSAVSIYAYHTDSRYAADDHRAAAHFLSERWRPGDAILVNAGYTYTALLTYWHGDPIAWRGRLAGAGGTDLAETARGPVIVATGTVDGEPSLGWGDPDSDFYATPRDETARALARLFAAFDRVWVYRIYDTVTDPSGFIRDWLNRHGTPFEDRVFTGESQLRVQGFLTGRDPLAEAGQALDVALADGSLRLVASASRSRAVEVGRALDLALVWEVDSPLDGEAILFAGLFDADGRRWTQVDERPAGSLYPVTAWPQGARVRTPLRLPVPPGIPPGLYRLEVGWYRFVDGQPTWLPWATTERLNLGEVEVTAPHDWRALPAPEVAHRAQVAVGEGVQLLGFDAPSLEAHPGDTLQIDLLWQALDEGPAPGLAALQLLDAAGQVLAEFSTAPVGGRVPFAGLGRGQTLRDPHSLALPATLPAGVYDLSLGRRRPDGTWWPVRRGPVTLGSTYPLATVRVLDRRRNLTPPTMQHVTEARFGAGILLAGYDLEQQPGTLTLTLHWQGLAPMAARYKVFVHLLGDGGPSDIRAQADGYPHLPTTGWVPGQYVSDRLGVNLPAGLPPGTYSLLVGLYDETTGDRLPVLDAAGETSGEGLSLAQIHLGQ